MSTVGYTRVSTEEQATSGYSLGAQETQITAKCTAHAWTLSRVYSDAGKSGKSVAGRGELKALLHDAQQGLFTRVVFTKLDRLSRSLRDLLDICDQLDRAGVEIVSISESIDTGTPAGRMMRNVMGSLAEFEREVIVGRIKDGLAQAAREGTPTGPIPLGYVRDEDGLVKPDQHAPMVAELFDRYASGAWSLRQLSSWATSTGLRSTKGNVLDRMGLRKILTNRFYVGELVFHARSASREVFAGKHEAIVDVDVFEYVQKQLQRRRKDNSKSTWGRDPYPVSGIAICAHCGAGLSGCQSGKRLRYLRCSTAARRGKSACRQPMVPAELVESQVAAYLSGMALPREYVDAVMQELKDRHSNPDADAEAVKLRGQVERFRMLFVMGEIDEDRFRREAAPLKQEIDRLEGAAVALDTERALQLLTDVGRTWAMGERRTQRDMVTKIFDRIVVDGAQVKEIAPKASYLPLFKIDRQQRFGGVVCSLAPRAGSSTTELHTGPGSYHPVIDTRTGAVFDIPALAVAA